MPAQAHRWSEAPDLIRNASKHHPRMLRSLEAYRHMFLYELPLAGQPAAGGTVCAIISELASRFGSHLRSWRSPINGSEETMSYTNNAGTKPETLTHLSAWMS